MKIQLFKIALVCTAITATVGIYGGEKTSATTLTNGPIHDCDVVVDPMNMREVVNIPGIFGICRLVFNGVRDGVNLEYEAIYRSSRSRATIRVTPFELTNISGAQIPAFTYQFPQLPYNFNLPPTPDPKGLVGASLNARFIGNPGNEVMVVGPNRTTNVQARATATATSAPPPVNAPKDPPPTASGGQLQADAATVFVRAANAEERLFLAPQGDLIGDLTLIDFPTGSRFVSSPNTIEYIAKVPEPSSVLSFLSLGLLGIGAFKKSKIKR